jgi:hypothetical protein
VNPDLGSYAIYPPAHKEYVPADVIKTSANFNHFVFIFCQESIAFRWQHNEQPVPTSHMMRVNDFQSVLKPI